MNVTVEEVKKAHETIVNYFFQINRNSIQKPITMIDSDVELDGQHFRIFSFMTFWGRNEKPLIEEELK